MSSNCHITWVLSYCFKACYQVVVISFNKLSWTCGQPTGGEYPAWNTGQHYKYVHHDDPMRIWVCTDFLARVCFYITISLLPQVLRNKWTWCWKIVHLQTCQKLVNDYSRDNRQCITSISIFEFGPILCYMKHSRKYSWLLSYL